MHRHFLRLLLVAAVAVLLAGCSAESRKARALERAGGYYRAGDFERAQIEYQNVLQKFPDDRTANERLALIWLERGATMRALAYLNKMHTLSPGNLELRLKRAQLLSMLGRAAEAKREALAILERSTSIAEALVLLTETVRDPEDFKAADQYLQKFSERHTVSYHIASANLLMLRGDPGKARAALQRAIAIEPKSAAAHSAMAALYASQNRAAQAAAEHQTAAELAPIRSAVRMKHASYLVQTGAVPEATAALAEITRQASDYQPAWRALAQIAQLEKRFDDAQALIEKVLSRDSTDYEARILRSRIWLAKGETTRAIEDLQRLGEAFKGLGLEKHPLALAHLQNNDPAKAIAALRETVAQFPDNVEAILLLAQLDLKAGTPQPATAAMVTLVNRRPDLLQAYLLLIEASKAMGKLDDLARIINASLAKSPNNPQLLYVLGLIYARQEKPMEARQRFEKVLEVSPNATLTLIELINLDLKEGKMDATLRRAQALVATAPRVATTHFLLARVYATQGSWSEVEAAAIDAINLEANHIGAYGLLADSFVARKDQPGMVARVEEFLAKHPNEPPAVMLGGRFFTQAGQFAKAAELCERYLTAHPTAGGVWNNLAILYAGQLNQPERALELAQKARALDPSAPAFADTLGWILYQRKEYEEALPLLEQSAKAMPENPEVQYHFAMVNRMLGNDGPALAAFRVAAAAPGDFSGKDEALRQLDQLEKSAVTLPSAAVETPKGK